MYNKQEWKDEIPDLTKPIMDSSGKQKIDPQTGRPLFELVQEGTRITSARLNTVEGGIASAHTLVEQLAKEIGGNFVAVIDGVMGLSCSAQGLKVTWAAGVAYVGGRRYEVSNGEMALNPTQGQYLYVDIDGVVKKTTSQATAKAGLLLFYVATDTSGIISSADQRVNISLNEILKKIENVKIQDASLIEKGVAQLTNEINNTSESLVPTANAVRLAVAAAATDAAAKVTSHNNLTTGVHGAVSGPTASKLIIRDSNGRAQVAAPSANADIARLDTVNTAKQEAITSAATSAAGLYVPKDNAINILPNSSAELGLSMWKNNRSVGGFYAVEERQYGIPGSFVQDEATPSNQITILSSEEFELQPDTKYTLSSDFYSLGSAAGDIYMLLYALTSSYSFQSLNCNADSDWHRKSLVITTNSTPNAKFHVRICVPVSKTALLRKVARVMLNLGDSAAVWNQNSNEKALLSYVDSPKPNVWGPIL